MQAAVGAHIKNLGTHLGVELFDRQRRRQASRLAGMRCVSRAAALPAAVALSMWKLRASTRTNPAATKKRWAASSSTTAMKLIAIS